MLVEHIFPGVKKASLCVPNDPSGIQKATMPELQITSNNEEADIQAKMAECKWCKVLREEPAWLESERLKREHLEAEQHKKECELPEGVEPEVEEAGAKSGKKQVLEDATSLRAGEKRKVIQTRSGVPSESEAGSSGAVVPATISSDPLVVVVTKGFELIAAAIQTTEM
ncbi:hypothetical protein F5J12DRAFT_781744 [Pisolithus orientalis]|uniref:uncharacterized protein n=1 Tax=Pisolithus orientalis TaxID=936130 RepID=UPI002224B3E3|nr:uncharacterized protein F5J12DRAFT_781744 [Pisolithus orientalis]KAI6010743.1 hypothetical protein F5J12DRAFT_781744 [Pisolithus orientalis]